MAGDCPPVHPHLIDPKASAPLLLQTSPPLWHHLNTPAKKILSSITAHTLAPFSLSLSLITMFVWSLELPPPIIKAINTPVESFGHTETSHCGITDQFPHLPVPSRCVAHSWPLLGVGPQPGAGAESAPATHRDFANLGLVC